MEDPKVQQFVEKREARFAAREEERRASGKPRRGRGGYPRKINEPLTWQQNLVVSWTGMRGVVTLAAAAGTPLGTPGRDAILAIAFVVAIGTLLIQGTTLPALISALNIADPSEAEFEKQEAAKAQKVSQEASREIIAKFVADPPPGIDPEILGRYKQMASQQERNDSEILRARQMGAAFMNLRQDMLKAQREAIVRERNEGRLDDDVARTVIEQLDYQEAASFANRVDRL